LVAGIFTGNRAQLARAITLVESSSPKHAPYARQLIQQILPKAGGSIRLGLTGVPGAGKSTFIEALGTLLCNRGKRIAVLAIDPSSTVHGGSILGDKTRMETLCRHERAFIRPSPSGGSSGGVAARTREALLLCEAAGYDVVIVETVGVGQSETAVRTMTDCFVLLQIAGAGDELQGIKKGVIELADAIIVNKADGENKMRARQACADYSRILNFLQPFTPGWQPQALTCSSLQSEGIDKVWEIICKFQDQITTSGVLQKRRREQNIDWFRLLMRQSIEQRFTHENQSRIRELEVAICSGELSVSNALSQLLGVYSSS